MYKTRFLFRKCGLASYISHLDLIRTFQRAVNRAGLNVKYTEGFNPHAYMSVALPLSLGFKSECEILDLVLLDEPDFDDVKTRMNSALPNGIEVISVYYAARPVKEITAAKYEIKLIYDDELKKDKKRIAELFSNPPVTVTKKTKRGAAETDITDFIKELRVNTSLTEGDSSAISLLITLSAGNISLNPEYIVTAIEKYLPDYAPDFIEITRLNVYDDELSEFR